jgi:predicted metal-dependent peptidase
VTTMTCKEKMSKAKAQLIMYHPFFASIICNLPMDEDATLSPPTMATNGRWVKYHPDFVDKLTLDETIFVLCHEVGHCMFAHMFRRGHRDPLIWNLAGDFIINDLLVADGIGSMPTGECQGLHDPALVQKAGGTTDGVYDLIMKKARKMGYKGPGQGGKGDEKGDGPPSAGGYKQFDNCDDSGGSAADVSQGEAEMKVRVAQAAQAAKMCGKLGANLERLVNMALKPKVAWQDVLRRFVVQKAKCEYSFARPKRRFLAEDLYLPSLGGERMGELAIAVDCSGSIGQEEIDQFASELQAIKEDVKPTKMHIIYFHHEVSKYDSFGQDEDLVIAPNGTGGTAFSPIFRYIEEHSIDPVACVVLTDLCCSDFGPPPSYPVLWVSNYTDTAPWGEVVMMKDKR